MYVDTWFTQAISDVIWISESLTKNNYFSLSTVSFYKVKYYYYFYIGFTSDCTFNQF